MMLIADNSTSNFVPPMLVCTYVLKIMTEKWSACRELTEFLKILVFTLLWHCPPPCIPPHSSIGTRGTWTILDRHFVPISLRLLPSTHLDAPWSKLKSAQVAWHGKQHFLHCWHNVLILHRFTQLWLVLFWEQSLAACHNLCRHSDLSISRENSPKLHQQFLSSIDSDYMNLLVVGTCSILQCTASSAVTNDLVGNGPIQCWFGWIMHHWWVHASVGWICLVQKGVMVLGWVKDYGAIGWELLW